MQQNNQNKRFRKLNLYLFWIVILIFLFYGFKVFLANMDNPNQSPKSTVGTDGAHIVILKPNDNYAYLVNGLINGTPATFLLDTGASNVVLSTNLANKLGLKKGQAYRANTANGTIKVYATKLARIKIGNIVLNDTNASINPNANDDFVLLGMSALKKIEFSHKNGNLILKQPH